MRYERQKTNLPIDGQIRYMDVGDSPLNYKGDIAKAMGEPKYGKGEGVLFYLIEFLEVWHRILCGKIEKEI